MNTVVFLATLAMLAMANAAPVQEQQKNNLQSLLNSLSDQTETRKEFISKVQQDDDMNGSEVETQFHRKIRKIANGVKKVADFISFLTHLYKANGQQYDDNGSLTSDQLFSFWANQQDMDDDGSQANDQLFHLQANQQDMDDDGSQAEVQFLQHLANPRANKQSGNEDLADAQFWGIIRHF